MLWNIALSCGWLGWFGMMATAFMGAGWLPSVLHTQLGLEAGQNALMLGFGLLQLVYLLAAQWRRATWNDEAKK